MAGVLKTYFMKYETMVELIDGVWVELDPDEERTLPDNVILLWQSEHNGYVSVNEQGEIVRTPFENMTAYDTEVDYDWY